MFGKKFCSALCASSIAFSAASKSDASWKAYDITSSVFQMVKDIAKVGFGGFVTYACWAFAHNGEENVTEVNEDFAAIVALLGLVNTVDGLFSLLSDIGEIGNGITAGRAVQNKEDLEKINKKMKDLDEITKRIEYLERSANITGNRAVGR